ncbi:MAG: hypothetical protein Q7T33_14440 [Dehalococcoidia bacterium]|nr:hypothetical protein [Dehalococcoidia bacterium]
MGPHADSGGGGVARLLLAIAALSLLGLLLGLSPPGSGAETVQVDPVIWQFDRDYPGAEGNDGALPVHTVYVKTHDGTDWMSTYDQHPRAVSGPDAVRSLIQVYGGQGIQVAAWFVPAGLDIEAQVRMAEQVIDAGVTALYADLEPFRGFCAQDCQFLADNLWTRVRAERPQARLGVIYDPRAHTWQASATSKWLAQADVALPMCYWDTFAGQGAWGDPGDCVLQAKADLSILAAGKSLEFVPMLQGDSTPERFRTALDATLATGSAHASVWRRGVVSRAVWDLIAGYTALATSPPAPGWELAWGDVDCDGAVTIGDAQKAARFVIDLPVHQASPCPSIGAPVEVAGEAVFWADVGCDGHVGIGDAQKLARALVQLSVTQTEGCPQIGATVRIAEPGAATPSPTATPFAEPTSTATPFAEATPTATPFGEASPTATAAGGGVH